MTLTRAQVLRVIWMLTLFASFGWVADSGTAFAKFSVYALIFILIVACSINFGIIGITASRGSKFLCLGLIFIFSILVHSRLDDVNNVLKLFLVLGISFVALEEEILLAAIECAPLVFYSAIIGYIFSLFGGGLQLPGFLAVTVRRDYFITPLLSVFVPSEFARAEGPFWEPGVLAVYANIIILLRSIRYRQNLKSCWQEISLVLISRSAGGYIGLLLVVLAIQVKKERVDRLISLFLAITVSVAAINFFAFYDSAVEVLNYITVSVFDRHLGEDASFNTRSLDLYVPFQAALDSPLIGHNDSYRYMDSVTAILGYSPEIITNSFGLIAYFYGYPTLIAYAVLLFFGVKNLFFGRSMLAMFAISLFLIVEPIQFTLFMLLVLTCSGRATKFVS